MTRPGSARCVVVGSGGVAGVAWSFGIVAGLHAAGVALRDADAFVGTSAGAVVAVELAAIPDPAVLMQRQVRDDGGEVQRPYSREAADRASQRLLARVGGDVDEARRRIGAAALRARTPDLDGRREIIARRLSSDRWPDRPVRIVAVDAISGAGRVFDAASGVRVVDAVMASCAVPAVWPPVPIGGRHYIDGGVRSMTNADLAPPDVDGGITVVLAPLGWGDANPVSGGLHHELAALSRRRIQTVVITPDETSVEAIGENVLDPATRGPAADAGYRQGIRNPAGLAAIWTG